MEAGLVVHDPARAVRIDEGSVYSRADYPVVDNAANRILASGNSPVVLQNPSTPFIAESAENGIHHAAGGVFQLGCRNAERSQRRSKCRCSPPHSFTRP